MLNVFNRDELPRHLSNIPGLDICEDLVISPFRDGWFQLGVWTVASKRNDRNVEDVIGRQCVLLATGEFPEVYAKLESVGNSFGSLGKPGGLIRGSGDEQEYSYNPFHCFDLCLTSTGCEPLVFARAVHDKMTLFINPDIELFFELEKRDSGYEIWWDPRRSLEVMRRVNVDGDNVIVVEIRIEYLQKYLQARQQSLVVGHYRHRLLFDPSPEALQSFVAEDVECGGPERSIKAILQNWGHRRDLLGTPLQRRLHFWFEIKPPEIDITNPWAETPPFDPYTYTLPTEIGPVAPARWRYFRETPGRQFDGMYCDPMSRVYFQQNVLSKYEGVSGFEVLDDGSVSHRSYWGLVRSTERLGNEMISSAVVDFAEGVPFAEWLHWQQYVIDPPSREARQIILEEKCIPDAVNFLLEELEELNNAFSHLVEKLGVQVNDSIWNGSDDGLASRQLKWVYPSNADDDEFLKRATLLSTLIVDELSARTMRRVLQVWDRNLHLKDTVSCQTLGSRKLLERLTLTATVIAQLNPAKREIASLIGKAEKSEGDLVDCETEVHRELGGLYDRIRKDLAALAFLYDLRTHGGIAHPPSKAKAAAAAVELGLSDGSWHRADYLTLLDLISKSVKRCKERLLDAVGHI